MKTENEPDKKIKLMKTKTEEIIRIYSYKNPYGDSTTEAEILEDGGVCVRQTYCPHNERESHLYEEKTRYFKTRINAAKKLRKDLADLLEDELQTGEYFEAGNGNWDGEPYPIYSAIKQLEGKITL